MGVLAPSVTVPDVTKSKALSVHCCLRFFLFSVQKYNVIPMNSVSCLLLAFFIVTTTMVVTRPPAFRRYLGTLQDLAALRLYVGIQGTDKDTFDTDMRYLNT